MFEGHTQNRPILYPGLWFSSPFSYFLLFKILLDLVFNGGGFSLSWVFGSWNTASVHGFCVNKDGKKKEPSSHFRKYSVRLLLYWTKTILSLVGLADFSYLAWVDIIHLKRFPESYMVTYFIFHTSPSYIWHPPTPFVLFCFLPFPVPWHHNAEDGNSWYLLLPHFLDKILDKKQPGGDGERRKGWLVCDWELSTSWQARRGSKSRRLPVTLNPFS